MTLATTEVWILSFALRFSVWPPSEWCPSCVPVTKWPTSHLKLTVSEEEEPSVLPSTSRDSGIPRRALRASRPGADPIPVGPSLWAHPCGPSLWAGQTHPRGMERPLWLQENQDKRAGQARLQRLCLVCGANKPGISHRQTLLCLVTGRGWHLRNIKSFKSMNTSFTVVFLMTRCHA